MFENLNMPSTNIQHPAVPLKSHKVIVYLFCGEYNHLFWTSCCLLCTSWHVYIFCFPPKLWQYRKFYSSSPVWDAKNFTEPEIISHLIQHTCDNNIHTAWLCSLVNHLWQLIIDKLHPTVLSLTSSLCLDNKPNHYTPAVLVNLKKRIRKSTDQQLKKWF